MEAYPTNVSQGGDDLMEMRNMARSTGSETWNEDVAVLTDYIETNAKALGKVTVMTLNGYIRNGNESIQSQNSITKAMKLQLRQIQEGAGIATPFTTNQGKRPSWTPTPEMVEAKNEAIGSLEDWLSVIPAGAEAYHTTFGLRKNADGSKKTEWADVRELVTSVLYDRMEANFYQSVRSD